MNSVLGGVVALLFSIWGFVTWWFIFVDIFKGLVPVLLLFFGIAAIISGLRQMQSQNGSLATPKKKVEMPSDDSSDSED